MIDADVDEEVFESPVECRISLRRCRCFQQPLNVMFSKEFRFRLACIATELPKNSTLTGWGHDFGIARKSR
jgi:hypothetical protein